eukprot:721866-Rhodomonas_salina.1
MQRLPVFLTGGRPFNITMGIPGNCRRHPTWCFFHFERAPWRSRIIVTRACLIFLSVSLYYLPGNTEYILAQVRRGSSGLAVVTEF